MSTHEPPLSGLLYSNVNLDKRDYDNPGGTITSDIESANLITSMTEANVMRHKVVVDLDLPAKLIPSSTPGHFHLYIDHEMDTTAYFTLLKALAKAGIVEAGYYNASEKQGHTAVRLPWIKKGES